MKHPSRWSNKYARRGYLLLVITIISPFEIIRGMILGGVEVIKELSGAFVKIWRRSNDES